MIEANAAQATPVELSRSLRIRASATGTNLAIAVFASMDARASAAETIGQSRLRRLQCEGARVPTREELDRWHAASALTGQGVVDAAEDAAAGR